MCYVPTIGCIWHPLQEKQWDFEKYVDRLLLQQIVNQIASNSKLCMWTSVIFLISVEITSLLRVTWYFPS